MENGIDDQEIIHKFINEISREKLILFLEILDDDFIFMKEIIKRKLEIF